MSLCIVTQKHVFFIPYNQENTKKLNTSKILKRVRVEIRYLCLHMPILVVMACPGLPGSLSLHKGSPLWQQSVVTTMEKILLDKGWPPYRPLVCASRLPNVVGPDPNPVERNIHSRAQSWNLLEEESAQDTTEPEVSYPTCLALTKLMFHVAQQ